MMIMNRICLEELLLVIMICFRRKQIMYRERISPAED